MVSAQAAQPGLPRRSTPFREYRDWLWGFALVLAAFIAYLPVWHAGFIWDDDAYVTTNYPLRSWAGLWQIWFAPGMTEQYYPLTNTSFWIEYHLWALAPLGYHLDNVLLHALNVLLLWTILRRLGVRAAWLAAAIFALHPIGVETVAWITERKNTLSGFFYLGSILAALEFWHLRPDVAKSPSDHGNQKFYWFALALYLCALLSKTATVPLPMVILLLLWWKKERIRAKDIYSLIPFFLIGIAMAVVTVWVEKNYVGTQGQTWNLSWLQRCLLAGHIFWFYLGELIWPSPLIFVYPQWQIDANQFTTYVPTLAVLACFGTLFWFRSTPARVLLVALLYDLFLLAPVLGFFMLYFFRYSYVEDHLQYLASIGPITLFASGCVWTLDFATKKSSWLKPFLGVLLLSTLGVLTWRQCLVFEDNDALFQTTLQRNPGAWMAYNNLGAMLLASGSVNAAAADFQKSLSINFGSEEAHNNLGLALLYENRLEEADPELKRALEINPHYVQALNNLGNLNFRKGHFDDAIAFFQQALALKPYFPDAQNNLGLSLLKEGRVDEAVPHFQQALAVQPDHIQANMNLGNALVKQGKLDEAIASYQAALTAQPDHAAAADNIGYVYLQKGQLDDAISWFKKALALDPGDAGTITNLGFAYVQKGHIADAVAQYRQSLQLQPSNTGLLNNLAWILATCPDASLRNGADAVELAGHANEVTGGKSPIVLGGLAAAYAEVGQFSAAMQTAEGAIDLATSRGDEQVVRNLNAQIDFYKRKMPYRDASLTPRP